MPSSFFIWHTKCSMEATRSASFFGIMLQCLKEFKRHIINLRKRLIRRLRENDEVIGSDEQFFDEIPQNALSAIIFTSKDLHQKRL